MDARLDDRVHGARFLTEAAINALEEIDVVASRAPRAVLTDIGLDRDRKRGTNGFAKLASDAPFLAVRAEPRRLGGLLLGVLHRDFLGEKILEGQAQALEKLRHQEGFYETLHPLLRRIASEARSYSEIASEARSYNEVTDHGPPSSAAIAPSTAIQTIVTGMNTFQPRRMIWS